MIVNIPLEYKATQIQPERCQIDVVVTLDHWEFEQLRNSTLDDFDFIKDSLDKLPVTNDNTRHCIMALDESADDGILIDPQGYNYPRYATYVPNARQMLQMEQYPSLQSYNDAMRNLVEEITQLALNSHQNGFFSYHRIESAMSSAQTVPSFAGKESSNAPTYTLTAKYNNVKRVWNYAPLTLTDSNSVTHPFCPSFFLPNYEV